jgi:DDE domain
VGAENPSDQLIFVVDSADAVVSSGPDHVTAFRRVQRFTLLFADAARFAWQSPGDRWFVDEIYVKVNGVWRYVYRAVDQHGQVIDVLVSQRSDAEAARRFFRRAPSALKVTPSEVITDKAPVYPRVLADLVPAVWHLAAQKARPARPGIPPWWGSIPAFLRSSQTVDGATVIPSPASSPWIRRYPQEGFSRASRNVRVLIRRCVGGRPRGGVASGASGAPTRRGSGRGASAAVSAV